MRILVPLCLALLSLPSHAASTSVGRAQVVDGDTLIIEGKTEHVRLFGIDAPEKKQTCDDASGKRYLCGSRAADYLAALIGRNGVVNCVEEDRDRYQRIVAECSLIGNNTTLNAAMVSAGWAVDYTEYSKGRYATEEADAKANKRGLWAGDFVVPSAWRRGERLASEGGRPNVDTSLTTATTKPTADHKTGCLIKGNISGRDRFYHLPGQRTYEETKINEVMGERWFCSEREAMDAGWRAARD